MSPLNKFLFAVIRATILPWFVLVIASGYAFFTAPRHAANLDFYSTSAAVIPVTLLVLVLQARVFGGLTLPVIDLDEFEPRLVARWGWVVDLMVYLRVAYSVIVPVAMITAEFIALHALATGKPGLERCPFVYVGLAMGFATVFLMVFFQPASDATNLFGPPSDTTPDQPTT
jgi:hypothetical protein